MEKITIPNSRCSEKHKKVDKGGLCLEHDISALRDEIRGLCLEDHIRGLPDEILNEKLDKGGLCWEDHISGLPDEVLVSILSLLTMKEAARTSLLSKRWRYMWAYITGLNFDAFQIIYGILLGDKQLEVERNSYLSWVNQVLKTYNGAIIDEFRVQFDLDQSCRLDMDNWVNFAIENRVKRLELDFLERGYNFPDTGRITNHLHSLSLGFTDKFSNCPFLE